MWLGKDKDIGDILIICRALWRMIEIDLGILGVSNGLGEHLRACEQGFYFCEHERLSNFSCEQRAL